MKVLLTLGCATFVSLAMAFSANAAQFANIPASPIKMELTEKPVLFDHNVHTATDCSVCHSSLPAHFPPLVVDTETQCAGCHHKVANITPKFKCGTVGCHNPKDKLAKRSYFKIVHNRDLKLGKHHVANSCLSCHDEIVQKRPEKKIALTACAGSACHPKN